MPEDDATQTNTPRGDDELSEEKQEELNQIMSVYDLKRKKVR